MTQEVARVIPRHIKKLQCAGPLVPLLFPIERYMKINKNKYIYISKEVSEKDMTQWPTPSWLRRIGMMDLVAAMEMLSGEYGFDWADQWRRNWDNPAWLDRAMVNTFGRLKTEDQELLRPLYEDWQWYFANLDLAAAVGLGYVAEVALLWGDGRRVVDDGQVQTVLVSLGGVSREAAKSSLTSEYEFVRWVP